MYSAVLLKCKCEMCTLLVQAMYVICMIDERE